MLATIKSEIEVFEYSGVCGRILQLIYSYTQSTPPDIDRSTAQFFRNREYFLGLSRFVCVSVTRY